MNLKILVLVSLMFVAPIRAQDERLIEVDKIVAAVNLFFKVFSNNRGCVEGRVANFTVKKIVDPYIETKKLCLTKSDRANFTISYELMHEQDYFSDKKKIFFKPKGSLIVKVQDKVLTVGVVGLKYRLIKGATFNIKLLNFEENVQQISINTVGAILPVKLTANIKYVLKYFRFQYLYIAGVKFKLKDRSKN